MNPPQTKTRWLANGEECYGSLQGLELVKEEAILIAKFEKVEIVLPVDMETDLKPLVGKRVSILRLDGAYYSLGCN